MSRGLLLVLALPLLVIAAMIVGQVAIAAFRSPISVVLTVFAVIVPVGSLIVVPVPMPAPFNTASSMIGAIAVGALAVHVIGERVSVGTASHQWIPSGVLWWILFGALAAITFLWSVNPEATVEELLILLSLMSLYVLAAFARTTPEDLDRFESAIVFGGAIAAGYAIVLLVTSGLPEFGGETPRFAAAGGAGGEAGPNETAAALLLPLAVAGSRAIGGRQDRRMLWTGVAGLIAIGVALTASRGGLLAMFVVVTILAVNAGRSRIVVAMVLFAALALLVVPRFGAQALQDRLFKETSSGRTLIWTTAWRACDAHCLTGSGYGTFPDAYNEALGVSPNIAGQNLRQRAHNIWIRAAIEMGVVGLVLLTGALYLHLRDLLRLPRFRRGTALAGLSGVLAANVFLSNIGFKYFWLAMLHAMLTIVVWTRMSVAEATAGATATMQRAPLRVGVSA